MEAPQRAPERPQREAELAGKKAAQRGVDRKVGTSEFSQIGSPP